MTNSSSSASKLAFCGLFLNVLQSNNPPIEIIIKYVNYLKNTTLRIYITKRIIKLKEKTTFETDKLQLPLLFNIAIVKIILFNVSIMLPTKIMIFAPGQCNILNKKASNITAIDKGRKVSITLTHGSLSPSVLIKTPTTK